MKIMHLHKVRLFEIYIYLSQLICLLQKESFLISLSLVESEPILTWGLPALEFFNKPGLLGFKLSKSQLRRNVNVSFAEKPQ